MVKACDIISKKYNKLESKYGSTRSTLFGKFYERIISKFSRDWLSKKEVEKSLKGKVSHCTLDGVFKKNTKFYIWEAKNWPLYPEKGPKPQIKRYLTTNPWIIAEKFDLSGKEYEISGFLFSFWYIRPKDKIEIEEVWFRVAN